MTTSQAMTWAVLIASAVGAVVAFVSLTGSGERRHSKRALILYQGMALVLVCGLRAAALLWPKIQVIKDGTAGNVGLFVLISLVIMNFIADWRRSIDDGNS